MLHRDEDGRVDVIRQRLRWIRSQRAQLEDAESFLEHVIGCRHDFLTRCPDCTRYALNDADRLPGGDVRARDS